VSGLVDERRPAKRCEPVVVLSTEGVTDENTLWKKTEPT